MSDCPTLLSLARYWLDPTGGRTVRNHVAECRKCQVWLIDHMDDDAAARIVKESGSSSPAGSRKGIQKLFTRR